MEEVAIGSPEGARGLEDVDGMGPEPGSQAEAGLDEPGDALEVIVGDNALGEDVLTVRQGMDEDHSTDLAVGVNPTGEVEAILQWLPGGVIEAKGVIVVFEGGIEQPSKGHGHRVHLLSRLGWRQGSNPSAQ